MSLLGCSCLVQIVTYSSMICKSISACSEYLSIFYSVLLCLDLQKGNVCDTFSACFFIEFNKVSVIQGL